MTAISLIQKKNEVRVSSLDIAKELGVSHKASLQLIDNQLSSFKKINPPPFHTVKAELLPQGGRAKSTRYALLSEDQAYFLLALSRNSKRVIELKLNLVQAFGRFRREQQAAVDYLPFYHELHDSVKALAKLAHQSGSRAPERVFHININRLINDAFGLESGQRPDLPGHLRAKVTAANVVAKELLERAKEEGYDHKATYQHVKHGITAFANVGVMRLEAVKPPVIKIRGREKQSQFL